MRSSSLSLSSLRHGLCAVAESILLVVCFLVTDSIPFLGGPGRFVPSALPNAVLHAFILQSCLYYADLYEDSAMRRRLEMFLRLGQAFVFAGLLLALVYFLVPGFKVGRGVLFLFLPSAFVAVVLWRRLYFWAWGREALCDRVLVLGSGHSAQEIAREMLRLAPLGFRVVGLVGEHPSEVGKHLTNPSVIGTADQLLDLVETHNVSLIVAAMDDRRGKLPVAELLQCRLAGLRVEESTNFFERLTGKILVRNLRPSWIVFSQGFNKPRILLNSKRVLELFAALALVVLVAPLLVLIALLVKLDSSGPVFYKQERVGEKGRTFTLLKYRTMRTDAEAATGPVWASATADSRITRLGRHMRRLRLDELPQILNVLAGDMSFVGPRPERPHFVEKLRKIIPYYDERHSLKPGITGWAQIKFGYGSNIEDAEEKLQYDLYYIKHMSLRLDVAIILDTLKVVVTGRGAR